MKRKILGTILSVVLVCLPGNMGFGNCFLTLYGPKAICAGQQADYYAEMTGAVGGCNFDWDNATESTVGWATNTWWSCGNHTVTVTPSGCNSCLHPVPPTTNIVTHVIKVDIAESNVVDCIDVGSRVFHMTSDSCCEVYWSLSPSNYPGGPYLSGGGCQTTVNFGTNCKQYTVSAMTSDTNVSCYPGSLCCDSASGSIVAVRNIVDGNGNPISSTYSNDVVIVGQPVNLTAQTCGGTFSNYQWTVAGSAFSDYVGTGLTGDPDNQTGKVVTVFALTNSTVSFYWKDAGSKQVSCQAQCGPATCSKSVTFTAVRPTASIATFTGSVAADGNYYQAGHWLHFGTGILVPGQAGILFSNSVAMPAGYYNGGSTNFGVEWVQKVNSWDRQSQTNDATGAWYQLGPPLTNSVLDTSYPFPQWTPDNSATLDAPARGLVNATNDPFKTVTAADGFTMWLMFRPSGGEWVPLRKVDWSWSGTAVLTNTPDTNGNYWVLTSSSKSASPDVDSTTHPEWTDNIDNHKFLLPK